MQAIETTLLFSEYKLGTIPLKNRFVMAPMTRSRALGNIPNQLMATYYSQRAEAGLIITEGTSPSPNGLGYSRIPGLFNSEQVKGWKLVTDAVHSKGSKIFVQLMHTGRVSHPANLPANAQILAPSPIAVSGQMWTDSQGMQNHPVPKEMDSSDLEYTKQEYIQSSKLAIEAGFDGVELHGANGYLLEQFLNANSNQRKDNYGGSGENRNRFVLEIVNAVVSAIGKEKVGIRLSPYGVFNDTGAFEGLDEQFELLAKELNKIGIAYIHIVNHSSMGAPVVPDSIQETLRKNFSNTYILSGGYNLETANADLEAKKGELVAFGRQFLANPNLVTKYKNGEPLKDPDMNTFYTADEKGFTDY
jgi:N-ethylmaleimide reductase